MLTRNDGTTTWNYTWTKENMLRQAAGGSTTVTFTYDGDCQLVRRSDQTGQITTILGQFYQATTYAATETSQTTSHYLFNGQLVAQRVGNDRHYFLTDHLGSTTTTLYPNGQLEATLRYDPWGNTRYSQNTTPAGYRYTSQRQDSPLGLYDYHARYYDPVISRFLSPDSIIPTNANNTVGPNSEQRLTPLTVAFHETAFLSTANEETRQLVLNGPVVTWSNDQKQEFHVPTGPTSPQLLNRYTYVLNAPLAYTDPTGHLGFKVIMTPEEAKNFSTWLSYIVEWLDDVGQLLTIAGIVMGGADVFVAVLAGLLGGPATAAIAPILAAIFLAALAAGVLGKVIEEIAETLGKVVAALNDAINQGNGHLITLQVDIGVIGTYISVTTAGFYWGTHARFFDKSGELLIAWMLLQPHSPVFFQGITGPFTWIRNA